MGSTTMQIIMKVLIPEALPSLIDGITLTIINLIGYSAMAGAIGGGGLGDLAIRYGRLADSGLVALPLLPDNRRVLCAAPAYLARAGNPASPADLARHNCLRYQLADEVHERWHFVRAREEISVAVSGDRVSDDGDAVRRWAVAGFGIANKSHLDVIADLRSGRLVRLCPEWRGEAAPLSLICADRRQLSPTVALLRDYLRQCCADAMGE